MDGFKNIEIKKFRGIECLKINDFSRVNVFLCQNNSGKSSILEAIQSYLRLLGRLRKRACEIGYSRPHSTTFDHACREN